MCLCSLYYNLKYQCSSVVFLFYNPYSVFCISISYVLLSVVIRLLIPCPFYSDIEIVFYNYNPLYFSLLLIKFSTTIKGKIIEKSRAILQKSTFSFNKKKNGEYVRTLYYRRFHVIRVLYYTVRQVVIINNFGKNVCRLVSRVLDVLNGNVTRVFFFLNYVKLVDCCLSWFMCKYYFILILVGSFEVNFILKSTFILIQFIF